MTIINILLPLKALVNDLLDRTNQDQYGFFFYIYIH